MNYHSFTNGSPANRTQQPLTIEQIGCYAPSALATHPHDSRSARYTYIPTLDIIQGMMRAGFQPFKASQSSSRIEGKSEFTKHMIRFRHQDTTQALAVGDSIPEVVLINSHDGTSAYKLIAGIFRLVCSNGLVVAESTTGSVAVHHKGNILDNVIEGSYRIVEDSQKAIGAIGAWKNLQLSSGEQSAFAEAAHSLRFADTEGKITTPITAAQLLRPRRSDDAGADLWQTMNRVQENVIKGGLHGVQRGENGRGWRNVTTRPVKGIDQDVKLNRAMWQLAERMAELKGGMAAAA
jgi:hypothetical protein